VPKRVELIFDPNKLPPKTGLFVLGGSLKLELNKDPTGTLLLNKLEPVEAENRVDVG